jgi:DNA-binding CsgD family transcriptional regulator
MNKPPASLGESVELPPIMEATALKLGATALTVEINGREMTIEPLEQDVLVLASQGGDIENVTSELSVTKKDVEDARDALIGGLVVPNMAAVVSIMISEKILGFEKANGFRRLPQTDRMVLALIAQGKTNSEIAKVINRGPQAMKNLNNRLFTMLNATGRTHSVRRCYELDVFHVF